MKKLKDIFSVKEYIALIENCGASFNITVDHSNKTLSITGLLPYRYETEFEMKDIKESIKNADYKSFNKRARARKTSGLWDKNGFLEEALLPPFVKTFWAFIAYFEKIPSPTEFLNFYCNTYCINLGGGVIDFKKWCMPTRPERTNRILPIKKELYLEDMACRINNCYCGLVRECVLGEDIAESFKKMKKENANIKDYELSVVHDTNMDIFDDADIVMYAKNTNTKKKKTIYVALYDKTERSFERRINKLTERIKNKKEVNYDLKIAFPTFLSVFSDERQSNTYTFYGICLYSKDAVYGLIKNALKTKYKNEWELTGTGEMIDIMGLATA